MILDNFLFADEGRLDSYDQIALFVDFKNRNKGIKPGTDEFKDKLRTDKYFNALQVKFGYAVTCHKSQGGEWKNVFVDFKVFMWKSSFGFFRWAYTAITRSSEKLLGIDAPEYNAFNQFVILNIGKLSKPDTQQYYMQAEIKQKYISYREDKIKELCEQQDVKLETILYNNQLYLEFRRNDESCKVQLWYNSKGFTKTTFKEYSGDDFKELAEQILKESLISDKEIEFIPKFNFQTDLHNFLLEVFNEFDVIITNIVQKEWSDKYYIQTSANNCYIEFHFNGKHFYTKAEPKSILGEDDILLKQIIEKLRG